ncbi:MAG: phosphoribosylaminoimidazolesuccinocarboxamide synthase [Bacteroidetes bacterium]|nr:phosphoribosylaminoimidazolesuccinocarboxamide synthase [Bacteroidota bacterium]
MAVANTNFNFPNQKAVYHGKVRDVYDLGDKLLMIATDRISAFDCILPRPIPYKGQVLNQTASHFLFQTKDICPNWLIATPDPNVSIGLKCAPFKVEMVIRGYLTGHAWRTYQSGLRTLCGVKLQDGMRENEAFTEPIITPTTKADAGHDEDISREDIIANGIVSASDYSILEKYTRALFQKGQSMARERGLILVDTKYEFGKTKEGEIVLIDEIHTPDSSRYFYAEPYQSNFDNNLPQQQLSKEFVRQWLIGEGFQGKENQTMPIMSDEFLQMTSDRYIELYELITGNSFVKYPQEHILQRIEENVLAFLNK